MRLTAGVDPGTSTGWAVYDADAGFTDLQTLDFWSLYDHIRTNYKDRREEMLIVVEDPNKIAPLYVRNQSFKGAQRDKIAMNVGAMKREASLLIERLQALGFTVLAVKPEKRKKWTHADMKAATNYTGKAVSEHARDSARLAWENRYITKI